MNVNDFKNSRFLKQDDVGEGVLVTIKAVTQENVAMDGAEPDLRPTIHFEGLDKPMVCNSTNAQIIAGITGISTDVEHGWVGKQIVLYKDPNISFGGKLVGGIRVRAPKIAKQEAPLPF